MVFLLLLVGFPPAFSWLPLMLLDGFHPAFRWIPSWSTKFCVATLKYCEISEVKQNYARFQNLYADMRSW